MNEDTFSDERERHDHEEWENALEQIEDLDTAL